MKLKKHLLIGCITLGSTIASAPADAQTQRAIERRAERNARQLQRQVNRADYYAPQTWQTLHPWINDNGVPPIARAANTVRNSVRATGEAVAQTVDAATRRGDGQFGYRDKAPDNVWFYDYYSYTPTYYTRQGDDRYASAIRYFDVDGDGVYDSYASYRDSDDDGKYDEYDRYDFYTQRSGTSRLERNVNHEAAAASSQNDDQSYGGPASTRRYQVEGEIAMTKKAQVNGNENLVVAVDGEGDDKMAIDLGRADELKGRNVEVGTSIVAYGAIETVGDKNLLVADSFRVDGGEMIEVERSGELSVTGEIVDVKTMSIDSSDHYLAIVEVDGERQLVDLGPSNAYKAELQPATEITVQGIPVRAQNNRVIMAQRVRLGGETVNVVRSLIRQ